MGYLRLPIHLALLALFAALVLPSRAGSLQVGVPPPPGVNPPVPQPDFVGFHLKPGVSAEIDVLANDSDPDHDPLYLTAVTTPGSGSATIVGNRIVYTPNWTFFVEDRFTYEVKDSTGRAATAEVVARAPLHGIRGSYDAGLELAGSNSRGRLQVTVGPNGALTASTRIAGKLHRFRGIVDFEGTFSSASSVTPDVTAVLQFTITKLAGPPERWQTVLTGWVGIPTDTFTVKPTEANGLPPGAAAQRVTLKLREVVEGGNFAELGYATGQINSAGRLSMAGRLPGGRPFSTSASMRQDGSVSIEAAVPRRRLSGEFSLAGSADRIFHWRSELQYTSSPPETTTQLEADLGTYESSRVKSTVSGFGGALLFIQPFNGASFVSVATLDDKLRCAFDPGSIPVRLKINRATGLATGSYFDSTEAPHWRLLRGVVSLPLQEISGSISIPNHGGTFSLAP